MAKVAYTTKYSDREVANPSNKIIHPIATGLAVRARDGKHKKITWAQVIVYAQESRSRNAKSKNIKYIEFEDKTGVGKYYYTSILVAPEVKTEFPVAYLFVLAHEKGGYSSHYVTPTSVNSNIYNDFVSGKIFSKLW